MPIDTPKQALTLDELPTAGPNEPGIQAVVTTATGAKKLPLSVLFEPYTLLIGSYQFYAGAYPLSFAIPMMGGVLDPADFEDGLQILKGRVPNTWINAEGKIQLPLVMDHVLQQDLSLQLGEIQGDAMQNIISNINLGHGGTSDGPFAGGNTLGCFRYGTAGINNPTACQGQQGTFDLSRAARTANKTRENTLNSLLCIITGQNKATQTKTYYIRDALNGLYTGWQIVLPVGKDGEGIGYNQQIMTADEPPEHSQDYQGLSWVARISSDPIGMAMRKQTRNIWTFDYFDEIYRKFRIGGVDVYFASSNNGVRLLSADGLNSITFVGNPTYVTSAAWGSSYGITYNSRSVLIEGQGFLPFTITGLDEVIVRYNTKEMMAVLSIVSGGKEIDQAWWDKLRLACPPDKIDNFFAWQEKMPQGVYNTANKSDRLDNVPLSRFYFFSMLYKHPAMRQNTIELRFKDATTDDDLEAYVAAAAGTFRLSDFAALSWRTFMLEGFPVELELDNEGIKWTAPGGYYLRIAATMSVGTLGTFYGQNKSIIFSATPQSYFVGGPGMTEIQATNGWSIRFSLTFKQRWMFFSFAENATVFDLNRINDLIRFAPAGREADMQKCFENLPKNWANTVNNDTMGSNWGINLSRFWMVGGGK